MGLFDHLFKTKAPTGAEKVEEHAAEAAANKPVEGAPKTPLPQKEKADPSAFLHPKNYVPRGAPGLTPAPRPAASGISAKTVERKPAPISPPPAADEIVLTLGDVLSRIPAHYLRPGNHEAKRELRFKINDLSSDIARGRAAVPLSRIAQLVPDIFAREVGREEDMEIRLPLQKLVEQIGLLRSRPKTSVVEKIARPVTAAELPAAARPVVPIEIKKEPLTMPTAGPVPAAQTTVLESPLSAAASPSQPPPIILSEPVVASKTVELKPSVESGPASAPVILGPPPVAEASPIAPAPAPPAAPIPPAPAAPVAEVIPPVRTPAPVAPVPEPPILDVKPVIEPVKAALEPGPIKPPASPEPVVPPAAEKIVIDWGAEVAPPAEEKSEETAEPAVHDVVAETTRVEPAPEGPKLAPLESPDIDPSEEKIHLSLAAILRQCPREILVGEMPPVDDTVRITLPFAPIDRQLVKGKVEVSALRFIVALPEVYQKYFVAKVGVKVPIPLEEVFQNLPAPKQELTPVPPTPPPVVLAPSVPPRLSVPEAVPVVEKPEPLPVAATPAIAEMPTPAPAVVEEKIVEPPATAVPPPPLPVASPVEAPKPEAPAAPVVPEEVLPAVAAPVYITAPVKPIADFPAPVIPPIFDAPEPMTVEKVTPPPLPASIEINPGVTEPSPEFPVAASSTTAATPEAPAGFVPPWLSVEPAPVTPQEVLPVEVPVAPAPAASAVPPISLTPAPQEAAGESVPAPEPAPPSITSAEVNAPPSENAPRLKLQQPFFRPQFVPPPIFGFTPPPTAPEPEPAIKAEPPSVLAGLTEAPPVETSAPVSGVSVLEIRAEAAPAVESPTQKDEPTSFAPPQVAPVVETPAASAGTTVEPVAEKPASPSEAEPSAEMIALAGEHDAPDIAHFSDEPVPFADLAETLAHETTYASALAEVVHVDLPTPEPAKAQAPVAAELPAVEKAEVPVEAEEHRPVPMVEGLAAAAVAATITEHVPLDLREVVAPAEESGQPEEATAPVEAAVAEAEAEEAAISEDAGDEESPSVAAEKVEEAPAAEKIEEEPAPEKIDEAPAAPVKNGEVPSEAIIAHTPAVLTPEPPAAAVPPPPPHPLFPLPKVHLEPAHVEVLPPPSLPLRRFDQDAIQALFMTEETLDLPKISRLAAALPGVYACVIATRDQACTGGNLPEGFDLAALLGLAPRVGEAAGRMPIGQLKHFTLYGDAYSVSFFERNGLSLCAVHRPRSFVPGVREKLVALADELSR